MIERLRSSGGVAWAAARPLDPTGSTRVPSQEGAAVAPPTRPAAGADPPDANPAEGMTAEGMTAEGMTAEGVAAEGVADGEAGGAGPGEGAAQPRQASRSPRQ